MNLNYQLPTRYHEHILKDHEEYAWLLKTERFPSDQLLGMVDFFMKQVQFLKNQSINQSIN